MQNIRKDLQLEVFVRREGGDQQMETHRPPTEDFFGKLTAYFKANHSAGISQRHERFYSQIVIGGVDKNICDSLVKILEKFIDDFLRDNRKLQVNFGVVRVFIADDVTK